MSATPPHPNSHFYTFRTNGRISLPVDVSITNLPPGSVVNIHSHTELDCYYWTILFSVCSNGTYQIFYPLVKDSNKGSGYTLDIPYDSDSAIYSFDSSNMITFVDEINRPLENQHQQMIYSHVDVKYHFIVLPDMIVFFWYNDDGRVIVKTLDLSSLCEESIKNLLHEILFYSDGSLSLKLFTEKNASNEYYSLDLTLNPIVEKSIYSRLTQIRPGRFNDCPHTGSSQYPDTEDEVEHGILTLCQVNLNSDEDSSDKEGSW